MRPLSICFVGLDNLPVLAREFGHLRVGGESVQHTLLARALQRCGHRISMVVADHGQSDGAAWHGIATFKAYAPDEGVPVFRFVHPRWTGLTAAMRRADAEIYYISCGGAAVGQAAIHVRRHGRRLVFRIAHDGDCLKDDKQRIRFWRDRRLYEYGLRRADAILAQTDPQRQRMKATFGLDSVVARMLVEPGVQDLAFVQRDVPALWVNNLRQFKRPDLAVRLGQLLGESKLHMIGGAVPGFEALYEQTVRDASRESNVEFHGQVPYHDVNDFYERARVFVNTSDSEGFPNSYLQAWARGAPVVAFFDPGGVIRREGLGQAVGTLEEMSEVVQRLVNDPAEWAACSARCKAFMTENYGERRILEPYLDVFARLADARDTPALAS